MKTRKFEISIDVPAGASDESLVTAIEDVMKAMFPHVMTQITAGQPHDTGRNSVRTNVDVRKFQDNFMDVQSFHDRFLIPRPPGPTLLLPDVTSFRVKFMQEELDEYDAAGTLPDKIDALVDLVYVALGTADLHGIKWQPHWADVQRANMTKERVPSAADSKRGHSLDVRKPKGWKGPDHEKILAEEY